MFEALFIGFAGVETSFVVGVAASILSAVVSVLAASMKGYLQKKVDGGELTVTIKDENGNTKTIKITPGHELSASQFAESLRAATDKSSSPSEPPSKAD